MSLLNFLLSRRVLAKETFRVILPLLQWRLTNDRPTVRASAADGLAKFGGAAIMVAPELMRLYREERDGGVQVAIARALYAIAPQFAAQMGISPENFGRFHEGTVEAE